MAETVTITAEHLKELESTIQTLTAKLKKANHCDIDKLKAYDKAHPEKAAERSKRYKDKNRDAYNARRRELRRLKKEAFIAPVDAPSTG